MAHARQQIRVAAKALLTGLPTTGANVFTSRVRALRKTQLPGLTINTVEDSFVEALGGGIELRELTLRVTIHAKSVSNLDDVVDQISVEVEGALFADLTLGIGVKDTEFVSLDVDKTDAEEQPLAEADLEFKVLYEIASATPETIVS